MRKSCGSVVRGLASSSTSGRLIQPACSRLSLKGGAPASQTACLRYTNLSRPGWLHSWHRFEALGAARCQSHGGRISFNWFRHGGSSITGWDDAGVTGGRRRRCAACSLAMTTWIIGWVHQEQAPWRGLWLPLHDSSIQHCRTFRSRLVWRTGTLQRKMRPAVAQLPIDRSSCDDLEQDRVSPKGRTVLSCL